MQKSCTRSLFFACVKHGRVLNSLFGKALKHIVQKQARHAYQRMTCGYGASWGVHNCVSGEHSDDILIFHHCHEIRICYVFHGRNATRVLWHHKSIVFVMSVCDNRAAAAGFVRHCL